MITNTAATNDVSIEGPEIKESLKVEDAQHGEVGEIDILSASVSNCLVPVLGRGTEGWNPWDAYLLFRSPLGAVPGGAVLPLPLPPLPAVLARCCWRLLCLEFIPPAAGAGGGTTAASAAAIVSSVILVCLIWL
jgi:hypothetical protein